MNKNSKNITEKLLRRFGVSAAILGTMVEKFSTEDAMLLLGIVAGKRLKDELSDVSGRLIMIHTLEAAALYSSETVVGKNEKDG